MIDVFCCFRLKLGQRPHWWRNFACIANCNASVAVRAALVPSVLTTRTHLVKHAVLI